MQLIENQIVWTSIGGVTVRGVQPQLNSIEGNKRIDDNFIHDTFTVNNTQEDNPDPLSTKNYHNTFTTRMDLASFHEVLIVGDKGDPSQKTFKNLDTSQDQQS